MPLSSVTLRKKRSSNLEELYPLNKLMKGASNSIEGHTPNTYGEVLQGNKISTKTRLFWGIIFEAFGLLYHFVKCKIPFLIE